MLGAEFLRNVTDHPQLHIGTGPREDRVYIVFLGPDECRVGWGLEPETIHENSWETLEAVLLGRRRAEVISHMTRIVGYYSRLAGWNRSKLAELRDRHKGQYGAPGSLADDFAGETPASKRAHAKAKAA